MTLEVHTLVQDTNHIDSIGDDSKKDHMSAGRILAVTRANLIAATSALRIARDSLDRLLKLAAVPLRLLNVPSLGGIIPDFIDVRLRAR